LGDHRRAGVADDAAADTVDRAFASGGRMKIGIPKEIKDHEFRVGATPSGVKALVETGHEVVIERDAGAAIGFTDELYCAAGAQGAGRGGGGGAPGGGGGGGPRAGGGPRGRGGRGGGAGRRRAPGPGRAQARI